jgi:uncharacterized membrane protein
MIGDCKEQLETIEKTNPEMIHNMNILGGIDVLFYIIIWIMITILGVLASVVTR